MRSRSGTKSSGAAPTTLRRNSEPNPSPTASTSTAQTPTPPIDSKKKQKGPEVDPEVVLENEREYFGTTHKLKRIFIGPSFDGMSDSSSWKRKGKQRAELQTEGDQERSDEESVWEDEGTSESDASSNWERIDRKRKLARGARRGRKEVSDWSESTATTYPSTTPMRSRRPSVHDWKGNSFEIGAEFKDMVQRREKRLRAEREQREKEESQQAEESKFLKLHSRGRTNSTATATSRSFQDSFVTARSTSPTSAPPPSPAAFQLGQPPLHIDEKYPEITQTLLRRPSDPPPLERSTSDTPAILLSTQPTSPIRSILRTKDSFNLNGSALGNGQPPPQTPNSPLLEVPKSFSALPSRLLQPPPLSRREASNAASVRFPDFPTLASQQNSDGIEEEDPPTGDQPPAPPLEVLSRPAPELKPRENKLKDPRPFVRAAADKMLHRKKRGDEVLRKERMLVRDDWSHRDDLPKSFDEHVARKYPTINGSWEELAVVWRPGRIELWGEYKFNLAASLAGSKKLRAVIPLQPRKTHLSIYSSVDLVFCLTHQPLTNSILSAVSSRKSVNGDDDKSLRNPHHSKTNKRAYTHLRTSGTNIFLFRARTIPTAKSWIWSLFRELGGQIPRTLEISCPALGAKIRVPVPVDLPEPEDAEIGARVTEEDRAGEGYRLLKARAVVDACIEQLGKVGEWKELGEQAKALGATFRLAWRRDGVLDWVEEGDDAVETDYAVIGGIASRQAHVDPVLELRPAIHYPTIVRLPRAETSGPRKLAEPPAVEGFVTRIKKNGQNERIYLTSHLGAIFRCHPARAHPPESSGLIPPLPSAHPAPLALVPMVFGLSNVGKTGKEKERFWRQFGNRSGVKQRRGRDWTLKGMENEEGKLPVVDDEDEKGKTLLETFDHQERKRAFLQITDSQGFISFSEFEVIEPDLVEEAGGQWETTEDPGGHEGMKVAHDTKRLRGLRSFIVKTRAGRKAKFECHSIQVRDEWVERLNALIRYWTIRDRADATAQMELSPAGTLVEQAQRNGQAPPTREELLSSPLLGTMYNWCILDGCRAILLSSTLHIEKELRGTFRKRHVLLLPGTLIEFNSVDRDMYGHPLPSPYHRRKFTLSLRDCYVYSGSLTSSFLAGSTNTAAWEPANGNQHRFPRCYTATDGLRTVDDEEDCTFVIVRTKHGGDGKNKKLNQKGVVRVYRARSKLERDQFVYTLNSAIERLLRSEAEREERLREFAWLEQGKNKE
ncbi:Spo71p [Sporobolomyces salmoneus]|uniref:Spo71p n=1 Tax=Sporobolomyces salmoneus TaxID=183962 RepID=UPI0031786BB3